MNDYFSVTTTSLAYLPPNNLFAFANEKMMVKENHEPTTNDKFVVGKQYSLNDVDLAEINEENGIYELVGIVKEINGIPFNSLIMKPIKVSTSLSFSLTKQDCAKVGVDYQEGLQLFPMTMDWQPIEQVIVAEEDEREFNPNDLSTYPIDSETRTIRKMIIRMTGFSQFTSDSMRTPFDWHHMNVHQFLDSLSIRFKPNSAPPNATYDSIKGIIITKQIMGLRHPLIIDNDSNSIFIELDFSLMDMSTNRVVGIDPSFLRNKSINDLITVTWIQNKNSHYSQRDNIGNLYSQLANSRKLSLMLHDDLIY